MPVEGRGSASIRELSVRAGLLCGRQGLICPKKNRAGPHAAPGCRERCRRNPGPCRRGWARLQNPAGRSNSAAVTTMTLSKRYRRLISGLTALSLALLGWYAYASFSHRRLEAGLHEATRDIEAGNLVGARNRLAYLARRWP